MMFFDDVSQIYEIARKLGTGVFVVPPDVEVEVSGAIVLKPEDKTVITIEQVREVIGRLSVRQISDLFVVIRPADKLQLEAANALLKSLEEPGDKVHFILVTDSPSTLLPTILSRASVYLLRVVDYGGLHVDDKVKDVAKRLMVAKGAELVAVAEEISKHKDGVRAYALSVVGAAIEMLYKTYYITGKSAFLSRLPKFLTTYEALARNGHVKLQIVAGLV